MSSLDKVTYSFISLSLNSKVTALELTIQQCFTNFKELLHELETLQTESQSYKNELLTQKEKCESKNCNSSEVLKKVIEAKDTIINLAASTATKLNETKNLDIINELFKILCGDVVTLTPPKDSQEKNKSDTKISPSFTPVTTTLLPDKVLNMSVEGDMFKDESVMEIDGTPGRTSPIILSKKMKNSPSVISKSGPSVDSREKKKGSDSWPTPESKLMKLCPSQGKSGRSRQLRLSFPTVKPTNVVDLTSSPELSQELNCFTHVQKIIKKESSENDETILPSPTSGPGNILLSYLSTKEMKLNRKPLSLSRVKQEEVDESASPIIQVVVGKDSKTKENTKLDDLEDSINILKANRFKSPRKFSPKKRSRTKPSPLKMKRSPFKTEPLTIKRELSPIKMVSSRTEMEMSPKKMATLPGKMNSPTKIVFLPIKLENLKDVTTTVDGDMTHCEESSLSILQHVNNLEAQKSPSKQPLAENRNTLNVESSSSRRPDPVLPNIESAKRKVLENVLPVYKEATVRKKAEKMALPAWYCDECKAFFGELYADEPEKIQAAIDRCSKHRGRTNPVRPRTPTGFWDLRWDVPQDTEEFNRRNNTA